MSLDSRDLDILDTVPEVVIETRSGARSTGTIIWVVVSDGEVFVRSVRGDAGKLYQRALADPEVTLRVADTQLRFQATPADDAESIARASEGLRRKYPKGRPLDSMLRPEVLETTLRLEPAG